MHLPPDFAAELRKRFVGDIRLDGASRVLYSTDASIYQIEPLGVAFPRTQEDLQAAVELAAKYRVPILARGSGSSLAGQAIGEALILDCSRWLDHLVHIDAERRTATIEPGVILESLNRAAARYSLQFGPDPASAERATMGGVIANNATGAHSIVYGMTADHLLSADVILADGRRAVLGEVDITAQPQREGGFNARAGARRVTGSGSAYAALLDAALAIRGNRAQAIRNGFPRTWRNSAGYRLNYLLPWSPSEPPEWIGEMYPAIQKPGTINLAHLLAGSEGTLAVIHQATVRLVPKPARSILGILSFDSIDAACDAVPALLDHHPSAVELIPRMILRLAQDVAAYAHQMDFLAADPAAILVVEFSGENPRALRSSLMQLGSNIDVAESPSEQARIWNLRKVGLGILDSRPAMARPAAFIEDCAVPVDRLGDFVREIQAILSEFGAEGGIYAHASAGCLHIRPILDLKSRAGVQALRGIAEQTLEVTLRLGGSMVSEHGDGIARGEWLRRTYGDELVAAMRSIKQAADPAGILNPGKMFEAPPMDTHLRYGRQYRERAWKPGIGFERNGGLATAIEQCNGQGVCRKDAGVMCPSFQATREEMHSTRGRANLLRTFITFGAMGNTRLPEISDAAFHALDLCLACKGCKAECPSGVDMAKLKSAFLEHFYSRRPRPLRDYLFGYFHLVAPFLSRMSGLVEMVESTQSLHWAATRLAGVAPRRPLPRFAERRAVVSDHADGKPVLFLRDPYNGYVETDVEQAAFDVLGAAGFTIRVVDRVGAGAALISKGFLKAARRQARALLADTARIDPSGDWPLVTIEPSELSTLNNDYPDLLPEAPPRALRRLVGAQSVEELLVRDGSIPKLGRRAPGTRLLFHPHCHEKAEKHELDEQLQPRYAGLTLLRQVGYEVELIDAGCCGMAGTFGYEAEHYELSQQIGGLKLFPAIQAAGETPVAATGAACRMQIAQATKAEAKHPLAWVARAVLQS